MPNCNNCNKREIKTRPLDAVTRLCNDCTNKINVPNDVFGASAASGYNIDDNTMMSDLNSPNSKHGLRR